MNIYLIISATIFFGFGVMWTVSNWFNGLIKVSLILMGIAGYFFFFHNMGFIVQQTVGSIRLY